MWQSAVLVFVQIVAHYEPTTRHQELFLPEFNNGTFRHFSSHWFTYWMSTYIHTNMKSHIHTLAPVPTYLLVYRPAHPFKLLERQEKVPQNHENRARHGEAWSVQRQLGWQAFAKASEPVVTWNEMNMHAVTNACMHAWTHFFATPSHTHANADATQLRRETRQQSHPQFGIGTWFLIWFEGHWLPLPLGHFYLAVG